MLTEERLQRIVELVEKHKSVSTQMLMDELGISESTARRDLNMLDEQGNLIRVRGGAMIKEEQFSTKDDAVSVRKDKHQDEKRKIARYAASLIQPNDFVYLDAGTTTELLIDYLSDKGYTTYLPGGEFKATTEAIVGDEATLSLQKYNFTKGFWGTNGVSLTAGFSTPDVKEAMVKRAAILNCARCYVLCDSSKFSQISCVKFGDFANADIITTKVTEEEFAHCDNILEVR